VTDSWYSISFGRTYQTPRFLAALATYSDTDNCELRYQNLSTTGVQVRVEEDTTYDSETQHLQAEAVHYLVFAGSGGLRARVWGSGDEVRKYYALGSQRVAMRVSGAPASTPTRNGVYYLYTDHLGSTSLVTTGEDRVGLAAGSVWTRQLYDPYGAVRYADNPHGPAPTDYGYTGQRATDLGLMDYRARWYIPALGRFASADTIAPGVGGQALNRYMYVGGNPCRHSDPSGHFTLEEIQQYFGVSSWEEFRQIYGADLYNLMISELTWGDIVALGNGESTDMLVTFGFEQTPAGFQAVIARMQQNSDGTLQLQSRIAGLSELADIMGQYENVGIYHSDLRLDVDQFTCIWTGDTNDAPPFGGPGGRSAFQTHF